MAEILYVDTCVWLNLLKKEVGSSISNPLWKRAENFFSKVMLSGSRIAYSGIVLREVEFKLTDSLTFKNFRKALGQDPCFLAIELAEKDYALARVMERECAGTLSFYDLLHLAICRNRKLILVTRDRLLLKIASAYIKAILPEDLSDQPV